MNAVMKPPAFSSADFARTYAEKYGFHIVPLPPKTKRPLEKSWGKEVLHDPNGLHDYFTRRPDWNMGVVLGPSRICSFDVDDFEATKLIFEEFGWDFNALYQYPTIQGSPDGCRFMFRVPDGMKLGYQKLQWPQRDDTTKKYTVWELRSVNAEQQMQDVLPPSIHPETNAPYVWLTKPNGHFPPPPEFLLKIWENLTPLEDQFKAVCPWAPKEQPRPRREPKPLQPGQTSVIDAFNHAHDIESSLVQYGYKKQGKRYLSPHSQTGLPGVTVFSADNRCWIHHASDPLCSTDKGQPVSPFDFYREIEHGGDYTKSVRAAAEQLGMTHAKPIRAPETVDPETGEITTHPDYTGAPYITPEAAKKRAPPEFTHTPMDLFSETPAPELRPEWLPPAIANYAFDQAELLAVSPAMIAIPSLVACASAIHDGIEVQPKRYETSWRESARLWCAVVGPPSVRKSPSLKRATSRLRKINKELCEANEANQSAYQAQSEDYKELKKLSKKTGDPLPAPPAEPVKSRMIVEDVTVEALSEILKHNSRGVLCIQDELTGWFGSMDAYSGGKSGNKDRAHWLEIYNGGHRMVDRVMRGNVSIPNWSACMIGGIQPDMMRKVASQMGEDGLMQRFMVIMGKNTGKEMDRQEDAQSKADYSRLIDSLYSLQPSPNPVLLTEEAHIVRERIADMANSYSEYGALPGGLRSHMGKWTGLFARLLLTYHVIDCSTRGVFPTSQPIPESTALQVESLMSNFLYWHSLSFYNDVMTAQSDLEHVRWLAGHVLAHSLTEITNRDITQAYRAWRGIDEFRRQRIMMALEDGGWLNPTGELTKTFRKPSAWVVNPEVHVMFNVLAVKERSRRTEVHAEVKSSKTTTLTTDRIQND